MASEVVGSVSYDARIDSGKLDGDARAVEGKVQGLASSIQRSAGDASQAFGTVADGLGKVLKATIAVGAIGALGIGAAAKASWDQVSAVQQATVALNAYEKDTTKVNSALKSLVAYAQSDLGVLFNRKDLFASAQSLKIMGDNTADLSSHVQILSRSVGLGLSNWEELNLIVGRVGSTGRLTGIDFDNLTKAGYRLDPALRNTNITFDELFKALDKGIPTDALAGQANTIQGLGIRLQTAFRGIGNAILGVDAETNQFVKGGLGDTLVGALKGITDVLKDPVIKEGFANLGKQIAGVAQIGIPKLVDGFRWLLGNLPTVEALMAGLTTAFIVAKGAAILFNAVAAANPLTLLATAITLVVGGLVFLQLKFDAVNKALDILHPSLKLIWDNLKGVRDALTGVAGEAGKIDWKKEAIETAKNALIALNNAIISIGTFVKSTARSIQELWDKFTNSTPVIIIAQYFQQVILPALKDLAGTVTERLLPALSQLWDSFTRLWQALNPALTDALKIIGGILVGAFLAAIYIGIQVINIFVGTISSIATIIGVVIGWVSNLIGWFGNLVGVVWNTITTIATIFWNLPQAISDVVKTIAGLFWGFGKMILNAIGDTGKILYNAGKKVIDGFIDGIKDKFGDVKSTLGDLTHKLTDWKGPPSTDKTILKQSGQFVIQGFIAGLESMYGGVHRSLGSLTNSVGAPSISSPSSDLGSLNALDSPGTSSNSAVTVQVNMNGIMARSRSDLRDIGKDIIRAVNDELGAKQQPLIGNGAL